MTAFADLYGELRPFDGELAPNFLHDVVDVELCPALRGKADVVLADVGKRGVAEIFALAALIKRERDRRKVAAVIGSRHDVLARIRRSRLRCAVIRCKLVADIDGYAPARDDVILFDALGKLIVPVFERLVIEHEGVSACIFKIGQFAFAACRRGIARDFYGDGQASAADARKGYGDSAQHRARRVRVCIRRGRARPDEVFLGENLRGDDEGGGERVFARLHRVVVARIVEGCRDGDALCARDVERAAAVLDPDAFGKRTRDRDRLLLTVVFLGRIAERDAVILLQGSDGVLERIDRPCDGHGAAVCRGGLPLPIIVIYAARRFDVEHEGMRAGVGSRHGGLAVYQRIIGIRVFLYAHDVRIEPFEQPRSRGGVVGRRQSSAAALLALFRKYGGVEHLLGNAPCEGQVFRSVRLPCVVVLCRIGQRNRRFITARIDVGVAREHRDRFLRSVGERVQDVVARNLESLAELRLIPLYAAAVGEAAFACARLRERALFNFELLVSAARAVRIFTRNDDAQPVGTRIDGHLRGVYQRRIVALRDALSVNGIAECYVRALVSVQNGGRRDGDREPFRRRTALDDIDGNGIAVRPVGRNFDYDFILQLADREADDRVLSAFAARVDDVVRPAVIVVGQTHGYGIRTDHIHHVGGDPALFALYVRQSHRRHVFHDRRVVAFDHVLRDLGLIVGGQAAVLPCQGQRVLFDDDRAVESERGVVFRALDARDHIIGARGRFIVEENRRLKDFVIVNVRTLFARARFVILVGHAFGAELRLGSGGRIERFELRVRRGAVALVRPAVVRVVRRPFVHRAADRYRKRTGVILVVGRAHLIVDGVGVRRCDIAVGVVHLGQIADLICKIPSGEAERPADLLIVDRRSRVRSEQEAAVCGIRIVFRLVLFEEVVLEAVVDDTLAAHRRNVRKVRRVNGKVEGVHIQHIIGIFVGRRRSVQRDDDRIGARFRRRGLGRRVLIARKRRARIGVHERQRTEVVTVNIRQCVYESGIRAARVLDVLPVLPLRQRNVALLQGNGAGNNFQRAFVSGISPPASPVFAVIAVDRIIRQITVDSADARDVSTLVIALHQLDFAVIAVDMHHDPVGIVELAVALARHVIPIETGKRVAVVNIGMVGRLDPYFLSGDLVLLRYAVVENGIVPARERVNRKGVSSHVAEIGVAVHNTDLKPHRFARHRAIDEGIIGGVNGIVLRLARIHEGIAELSVRYPGDVVRLQRIRVDRDRAHDRLDLVIVGAINLECRRIFVGACVAEFVVIASRDIIRYGHFDAVRTRLYQLVFSKHRFIHRAVIGEHGLVAEACAYDSVCPVVVNAVNLKSGFGAAADRIVIRIVRTLAVDNRRFDAVFTDIDGQCGRSEAFAVLLAPIFNFKLQLNARCRLQRRDIFLACSVVKVGLPFFHRQRNGDAHRADDEPGAVCRIVAAAGRFLPIEGDRVVFAEVAIAVQMYAVDIISGCLGYRRTGDRQAFGIVLRIDRKRPDLRGVVPRVEVVVPFARANLGGELLVHLVRRDAVGRALIVDVHGDRARRDFEGVFLRLRVERVVAQARGGFGIHRHLHVVLADVAALAARRIIERLVIKGYAGEHGFEAVVSQQVAVYKVVQRVAVGIPFDVADFRAVDRRRAVRGEGERRLVNLKGDETLRPRYRDMVGRADAVIDFIRTVMVEVVPFENDIFERSDGFTEPRVQAEHPRYLVARGDGGRRCFRFLLNVIGFARIGQFGHGIADRNVLELRRNDLVFFAQRRGLFIYTIVFAALRAQRHIDGIDAGVDGFGDRAALCIGGCVEFFLPVLVASKEISERNRRLEPSARIGLVGRSDRHGERALFDGERAGHDFFHRIVGEGKLLHDLHDVFAVHNRAGGIRVAVVHACPVPGGILFAENVLAVLVFESFDIEAVFLHVNFIAVDYGDVMDTQGKLLLADDVICIFGGIVVAAFRAAEAIVFVAQRDRNGIRARVDGRIRSRVPLSRIQPFDAQFIVIVANTVLTVEGDGSIPVCIAVGMRERVLVPIGIEHFGHDDIGAALRAAGKVIITPGGALLFQRRLYFVFADADRLHSDSEGSEAAAFALDKIFIGETEHIAVDKVRSEILRGNRDARIGQLVARGQVKIARKSELRDFERVRRVLKKDSIVCRLAFSPHPHGIQIYGVADIIVDGAEYERYALENFGEVVLVAVEILPFGKGKVVQRVIIAVPIPVDAGFRRAVDCRCARLRRKGDTRLSDGELYSAGACVEVLAFRNADKQSIRTCALRPTALRDLAARIEHPFSEQRQAVYRAVLRRSLIEFKFHFAIGKCNVIRHIEVDGCRRGAVCPKRGSDRQIHILVRSKADTVPHFNGGIRRVGIVKAVPLPGFLRADKGTFVPGVILGSRQREVCPVVARVRERSAGLKFNAPAVAGHSTVIFVCEIRLKGTIFDENFLPLRSAILAAEGDGYAVFFDGEQRFLVRNPCIVGIAGNSDDDFIVARVGIPVEVLHRHPIRAVAAVPARREVLHLRCKVDCNRQIVDANGVCESVVFQRIAERPAVPAGKQNVLDDGLPLRDFKRKILMYLIRVLAPPDAHAENVGTDGGFVGQCYRFRKIAGGIERIFNLHAVVLCRCLQDGFGIFRGSTVRPAAKFGLRVGVYDLVLYPGDLPCELHRVGTLGRVCLAAVAPGIVVVGNAERDCILTGLCRREKPAVECGVYHVAEGNAHLRAVIPGHGFCLL